MIELISIAILSGLLFGVTVVGWGSLLPVIPGLDSLERFCVQVAFALVIVFVAVFGVFSLNLSTKALSVLPVAGCALIGFNRRSLLRDGVNPEIQRVVFGLAVLALWTFWHIAYIRTFNGAGWSSDWLEHYQRSLYLLGDLPENFRFISLYDYSARPPLANALTAYMMSVVGRDFVDFQIAMTMANVLVFLPLALVARRLAGGRIPTRGMAILLLLLMVNPMFMQNLLYPWTRPVTAFFVVLGVYLFFRAGQIKENAAQLELMGFVILSAGFLSHYSAGPYLLVTSLAYLWRHRRELVSAQIIVRSIAIVIVCSGVLSIWLIWSVSLFGAESTFLSNTSITDVSGTSLSDNLRRIRSNVINTLVPHVFRGYSPLAYDYPADSLYALRDHLFFVYQTSLVPAAGVVLTSILVWHFRSHVRSAVLSGPFWYFAILVIVGVAVYGGYDHQGAAHVCLQPVVFGVVCTAAAVFLCLSAVTRALLVAGAICEFGVGMSLHVELMHRTWQGEPLALAGEGSRAYAEAVRAYGYGVIENYSLQAAHGLQLAGEMISLPSSVFWMVSALSVAGVACWVLWPTRRVRQDS